jgi:hypothetical protein
MLTRSSVPPPRQQATLDELIGQIADSDAFRMAPMMRALLLYLWKHKGEAINEYAIAVDALGRPQDFDPKTDSTVRVQVARLRSKLKDFYENAGESFPLRVSVPLGRYELIYTYEPSKQADAKGPSPVSKTYVWFATGIAAILAITSLLLWRENRSLRTASIPPLSRLWQAFGESGKPSLVVVPSPLYFYWPKQQTYVRDLSVFTFNNWTSSKLLNELGERWGPPELAQTYVGAMEMSTGVRLLQYLDKRQAGAQLIESRKFSEDSFANQNIVFLGMPRTTAGYLDRLLEKTTFYMAQADPDIIRSRKPLPGGAPEEFREKMYSPDRRVYPAVIVFLPKRPEGTRCLLILGRYLTGAASMLLSVDGMKLIENQWEQAGSPEAWEMVVESEIYRDTLLNTRPRAFRLIAGNFWEQPKGTAPVKP